MIGLISKEHDTGFIRELNQIYNMAISKNLLLKGLRGSINKQIVVREFGDKTIISAYPDMSKVKFSSKQKRCQDNMSNANEYAQSIVSDESKRNTAQLRLNVPRNKLYRSLIREHLRILKAGQSTPESQTPESK